MKNLLLLMLMGVLIYSCTKKNYSYPLTFNINRVSYHLPFTDTIIVGDTIKIGDQQNTNRRVVLRDSSYKNGNLVISDSVLIQDTAIVEKVQNGNLTINKESVIADFKTSFEYINLKFDQNNILEYRVKNWGIVQGSYLLDFNPKNIESIFVYKKELGSWRFFVNGNK